MYDYEYQDYVHIYNVCVSALVGMLLLIIIATLPGAVGAGPIYTSMLGFITWLPPPPLTAFNWSLINGGGQQISPPAPSCICGHLLPAQRGLTEVMFSQPA